MGRKKKQEKIRGEKIRRKMEEKKNGGETEENEFWGKNGRENKWSGKK